jgi:LuxR family quorum-sensing transcriptional regulator LasR
MSPLWNAADESAWFEAISFFAGQHGFERFLIAILPRAGMRLEDAFLRSTYACEWRQNYDEKQLAYIDPTVAHCLSNTGPLIWSPDIFVTRSQQTLYEEARGYGLNAGVVLPVHGAKQETGMLCFVSGSSPTAEFSRHVTHALPALALLRDIVLDTSQRYLATHLQSLVPKLTPREQECLKWSASGKTCWEISRIFCCSQAAVNFHMKNIREKFGVSSVRAAAVIATRLRLIEPA